MTRIADVSSLTKNTLYLSCYDRHSSALPAYTAMSLVKPEATRGGKVWWKSEYLDPAKVQISRTRTLSTFHPPTTLLLSGLPITLSAFYRREHLGFVELSMIRFQ